MRLIFLNRLYIDEKGYTALDNWAVANKNYVLIDSYYFNKCEIYFKKRIEE